MARSTHIYLVCQPTVKQPTVSPFTVIAAFTVKHECQAFMEDARDPHKGDWVVRRYRDGAPWFGRENEQGVVMALDA